jgi:hypothetical protein
MSLKWQFYRYSHKLFYNGLPTTPIDFFEQANHIQGPQTNFTVSPRPSNGLLAILKNILELKQWSTGSFTEKMGNLSSSSEEANSQWEQIFKCRLES